MENNKSISNKFAEFVYGLDLQDIPKEVIDKAKLHLIDTLGIIMAMHNFSEIKPVVDLAKYLSGPSESLIVGHRQKVATPNAALANATMAHSVDFDDTHVGAVVHVSSIVVPTALAVGEKVRSSGSETLEAIIAGYEVTIRLGLVAPTLYHLRGFHPTGVVGVFGAALVAGKLLNLSTERLIAALGIAGSMASGIWQAQVEGMLFKPIHPGIACHNGILAAMLAEKGFNGPYQVFEGSQGFFNAYLKGERIDPAQAVRDLGKRWETLNISIKPYPTCHATHAPIDLTIALKRKYGIDVEDVKECKFYVPKLTIHLVAEPYQEKVAPKTPYAAKFSLPYTVIVALKKGRVGLWDFTEESIRNPEVLRHTPKVKAVYDKAYDRYEGSYVWPARISLALKDGHIHEEELIDHKGTPQNPLSRNEVIEKFLDNIKPTKYRNFGDEIAKRFINIEKYNIQEVMEILS